MQELIQRVRRTSRAYWIVTGLMSILVIISAIPDVIQHAEAISIIKHLGYPTYLLPFIGSMKILAIFAVLFPAFPTVKEWAYAGLTIDLVGATYSSLSVGDSPGMWLIPLLVLAFVIGSYASRAKVKRLVSIVEQRQLN